MCGFISHFKTNDNGSHDNLNDDDDDDDEDEDDDDDEITIYYLSKLLGQPC